MPHIVLDALISLLPPRYRRGIAINAIRGGAVSGVLEALLALAFLGYFYAQYMKPLGLFPRMPWEVQPATDWSKVQSGFGTGALQALGFWFTPGAIVSLYFMFEGVVRGISAGISHDPCAMMPLWLVGAIHDRLDARAAKRRMAQPAPDQVEPGKPGDPWDIRVTSVHAKRDWHKSVTISYAGSLYEIVTRIEDAADDKPPYVYGLKKKGEIGAFRGIVHYDPFEFWKQQR